MSIMSLGQGMLHLHGMKGTVLPQALHLTKLTEVLQKPTLKMDLAILVAWLHKEYLTRT